MNNFLWLIFVAYTCPVLVINLLLKKIKNVYWKFTIKQIILIIMLIVVFIFFQQLNLLTYQTYLQINITQIYWIFIGITAGILFIFLEMITYAFCYKKHLSNINFGTKKKFIEYVDIICIGVIEEVIYRLILLNILQTLNVPIVLIILLISICFLLNHWFILQNSFHIFSKFIFSIILTFIVIYFHIWYFALLCHLTYNLVYVLANLHKNRKEVKNDKNER